MSPSKSSRRQAFLAKTAATSSRLASCTPEGRTVQGEPDNETRAGIMNTTIMLYKGKSKSGRVYVTNCRRILFGMPNSTPEGRSPLLKPATHTFVKIKWIPCVRSCASPSKTCHSAPGPISDLRSNSSEYPLPPPPQPGRQVHRGQYLKRTRGSRSTFRSSVSESEARCDVRESFYGDKPDYPTGCIIQCDRGHRACVQQ